MRIKNGVEFKLLIPQMWIAMYVADEVYRDLGVYEGAVITSGTDGKHMDTSKHYTGAAFDVRIRNLPAHISPASAAREIRNRLGDKSGFDVVVESDHIHIEYDPK